MCITGGEAQRNRRIPPTSNISPAWGEIMIVLVDNLVPAGLRGGEGHPIRRLRFAPPPVMHITPLAGLRPFFKIIYLRAYFIWRHSFKFF
ncbi:MAG: hypothetical protein LBU34_03875 [Planctomycetaceae bacterium]|nr:hypothetical protein [Planctomycetaceae bacterium]